MSTTPDTALREMHLLRRNANNTIKKAGEDTDLGILKHLRILKEILVTRLKTGKMSWLRFKLCGSFASKIGTTS